MQPNKLHPTMNKVKKFGAIYTPEVIAEWLITEVALLGFVPNVIIDPAAGEGNLLEPARNAFAKSECIGLEIDARASQVLNVKKFGSPENPCNSLLLDAWGKKNSKPKLIISNPPWGALLTPELKHKLGNQFTTAKGQYDSYDLFVERIISELAAGDFAAILIPDSALLPQHKKLREIVTTKTKIHKIVRFPEGVFPGVAMGCLALLLEKSPLPYEMKMSCVRINRTEFSLHAQTVDSLIRLVRKNSHELNQSIWLKDRDFAWTLDLKQNSIAHLNTAISNISEDDFAWSKWFRSGRGLEIGKDSHLLFDISHIGKYKNSYPVAVGEDVNRRLLVPSKFIKTRGAEIEFKNELQAGERLFVRKTGIGIKAAIGKGIACTQTVYTFEPNDKAPSYALHYAAGFLTSRVIIALQLAKSGSLEWRSHPYVTQSTIKKLPLLIPKAGSNEEKIAKQIAAISQKLHMVESNEALEMKLDILVAKILGSDQELVKWANNFLNDVKGCSYTKDISSLEIVA